MVKLGWGFLGIGMVEIFDETDDGMKKFVREYFQEYC